VFKVAYFQFLAGACGAYQGQTAVINLRRNAVSFLFREGFDHQERVYPSRHQPGKPLLLWLAELKSTNPRGFPSLPQCFRTINSAGVNNLKDLC
jgi:hypothetical protein